MGTRVNTEDLKNEQIKEIILDAHKQLEIEKKLIAQGTIRKCENLNF
jgi:hypothetical protein